MRYIIIALHVLWFCSLHAENDNHVWFYKHQSKNKTIFTSYLIYDGYYTYMFGNEHTVTLYGYPQLFTYVADGVIDAPEKLSLTLPIKGCRCIYKCQNASAYCFVYDHDQAVVLFYPPCGFTSSHFETGTNQDNYDAVIEELVYENNEFETFEEWNKFNIFFYTPNSRPYYISKLKKGRKNYYLCRQQFVVVAVNILPLNCNLFKAYIDNTFTILPKIPK